MNLEGVIAEDEEYDSTKSHLDAGYEDYGADEKHDMLMKKTTLSRRFMSTEPPVSEHFYPT